VVLGLDQEISQSDSRTYENTCRIQRVLASPAFCKKEAVLLLVLTSALLALRERNPFFTFIWSSAFTFPLALLVSFRQILGEFEICGRFGGADVEGSGAEVGNGRLEDSDGTGGPELAHKCVSTES